MEADERVGVLLINTGSPDAPRTAETRAYLRQFLSDPRVIDIKAFPRWLLLNLVILPTRPKHSAHAYQQVWTQKGSPLIVHSEDFAEKLREELPGAEVGIGMAYGNPSIPTALGRLAEKDLRRIIVVPMFPQYASATSGSVTEAAYAAAGKMKNVPPLSVVPPYFDDAGYLDAWAEVAAPQLDEFKPDHVILSFHGLPERQIRKCDPTDAHCLIAAECCHRFREANPHCYRAHCFATTQGLVQRLGLAQDRYTLCFQSKLGRMPWLAPATDQEIVRNAKEGVKRLAVLSPAFVADCLETLEELGLRAKSDFLAHGGEAFHLVTSLNDHPSWVKAIADLVRRV